jgi:hypothetical protein
MDFWRFTYGECEPHGEHQVCARPVQVFLDPPCAPDVHPAALKEKVKFKGEELDLTKAKDKDKTKVRGVDVDFKKDGSIRLKASGFKATIYALYGDDQSSQDKAVEVAESLEGANALAVDLTAATGLDVKVKENKACR